MVNELFTSICLVVEVLALNDFVNMSILGRGIIQDDLKLVESFNDEDMVSFMS